jgi:hypothetical protein
VTAVIHVIGLAGVTRRATSDEFLLAATAQNLRKLAKLIPFPRRRFGERVKSLSRKVTFDSAMLSRPCCSIANAEEYWLDMEGLEHRDTVTDFALPEGTFFDTALVHLLTTATLDRLRDLYPQGRFEAHRFRPNIVVQTKNGGGDFVENAWIGKVLAIGDAVVLAPVV